MLSRLATPRALTIRPNPCRHTKAARQYLRQRPQRRHPQQQQHRTPRRRLLRTQHRRRFQPRPLQQRSRRSRPRPLQQPPTGLRRPLHCRLLRPQRPHHHLDKRHIDLTKFYLPALICTSTLDSGLLGSADRQLSICLQFDPQQGLCESKLVGRHLRTLLQPRRCLQQQLQTRLQQRPRPSCLQRRQLRRRWPRQQQSQQQRPQRLSRYAQGVRHRPLRSTYSLYEVCGSRALPHHLRLAWSLA